MTIPVRSMILTTAIAAAPAIGGAHSAWAEAGSVVGQRSALDQYIVQAASVGEARRDVLSVGGEIRRELRIVHGVVAGLTTEEAARVKTLPGVHAFRDQEVSTRSKAAPLSTLVYTDGTAVTAKAKDFVTNYPTLVGADVVQQSGITGKGVTIAVLDTGIWTGGQDNFKERILGSVDVTGAGNLPVTSDAYGHGTHITSIAVSSSVTKSGNFFGVAPGANLVIVRAFDGEGVGSYANVISGLQWVIANKRKYNIRVLNLSFGAPPQSAYWDDPLNQAVMAAWQAGIAVVVAAGNDGPRPMTIGVPGNVPYVITTGAITDNFTPYDATDDKLASFSSTGPPMRAS